MPASPGHLSALIAPEYQTIGELTYVHFCADMSEWVPAELHAHAFFLSSVQFILFNTQWY